MPMEKKPVEGLPSGCFIGEHDIFRLVEKGAEHDKPVCGRMFGKVLERFFHPEHVLAEASPGPFIVYVFLCKSELIAT